MSICFKQCHIVVCFDYIPVLELYSLIKLRIFAKSVFLTVLIGYGNLSYFLLENALSTV